MLFCQRTILALLLLLTASQALAQLMLYPTRVVFEGNQRAAQLELINNGTESATYRITLVNRRMNETGGMQPIEAPAEGERFAEELLRYSPRQITLEPGVGQTVRIMVRKPANLEPGEYRSHLLFAKQPEADSATGSRSDGSPPEQEVSIQIRTLMSVSIPVIVRHGDTHAEVSVAAMELTGTADAKPVLQFQLERQGNQSLYGDLAVSFTPRGGATEVVARANGVAVYAPNSRRNVRMALTDLGNRPLSNGTLRVTYCQQAKSGAALLAEATLHIP